MANSNMNPYNDEPRQGAPTPQVPATSGEVHGRPATREEIAYRNGYTEAQMRELREQNRRAYAYNDRRDQGDRTATGVLIGLLLAGAVGIIAGAFYWVGQTEGEMPVLDPQTTEPAPEDANPDVIERNTTVIERTVDRVEEAIPTQVPEVQITLPSPQPESSVAPAPTQQTSEPVSPAPEQSTQQDDGASAESQ